MTFFFFFRRRRPRPRDVRRPRPSPGPSGILGDASRAVVCRSPVGLLRWPSRVLAKLSGFAFSGRRVVSPTVVVQQKKFFFLGWPTTSHDECSASRPQSRRSRASIRGAHGCRARPESRCASIGRRRSCTRAFAPKPRPPPAPASGTLRYAHREPRCRHARKVASRRWQYRKRCLMSYTCPSRASGRSLDVSPSPTLSPRVAEPSKTE